MKYYQVEPLPLSSAEESDNKYQPDMRRHIVTLIGKRNTDALYKVFGNTNSILVADKQLLMDAGITAKLADILIAARTLRFVHDEKVQIRCSKDCFWLLQDLCDEPLEKFYILILDRQNKLIRKEFISAGGLSGTTVDTKALFHKVLRFQIANGIVLAHNHPSGNLTPSQSDIELTKKIVGAGALLDIKILDHIIVGGDEYTSFLDEGYI